MNLRRKGACDNESKMRKGASPSTSAGTGDACVCVCVCVCAHMCAHTLWQDCGVAEMTSPSGKGWLLHTELLHPPDPHSKRPCCL